MPINSRISNRRWTTVFFLFLSGTILLASVAPAQRNPFRNPQLRPQDQEPQPNPPVLHMRVEGGLITADIVNCPLHDALLELAHRTGVIFKVQSQDNPLISVRLNKASLEEAVERIAVDHNSVFLYGPNASAPGGVSMVSIFPRTDPVSQPGTLYLGTGVVTKHNDDIETPMQALKALEGNAGPEMRMKAIEILADSRGDEAVEALTSSLSDPAPEIRMAAIEALTSLGVRAALPQIMLRLKDRDAGVRQRAVTAVALLGDATNLKALDPLRKDRSAGVAAAAEAAIENLSASGKK